MPETSVATAAADYPEKVKEVLDKISEFTLLELSELVSAFEERFGITAAAPGAMGAGAAGGAPAEAEEEAEPTSFKVVLKGYGDKKIQVIKAVRATTNLTLKEAKSVVEEVPSTIKEGLSKEEADKCAKMLVDAGGEAEVQPE